MKSDKPLILVTNDDGITAPGITTLIRIAKTLGEVLVVAPDKPQSGSGHAITVNSPLRLYPSEIHEGVKAYSCSGTPVDCVKLAIYHVLKRKPDFCISGINHGSNCSINVLYSGTMSAAVEGAIEGIPSAGFSLLDHSYNANFEPSIEMVKKIISNMIENPFPKNVCLNVNIPAVNSKEELRGIKICKQGHAHWEDDFDTRKDPFGQEYHWLTGDFKSFDDEEDSDMKALKNNYISIVPTQFDMTAYDALKTLKNWQL